MISTEIKDALKGCEFFKDFGEDNIENVAGLCTLKVYEAGEYIFKQGDFGEHIYIIADGQAYLERTIDLGARKGSVTIETLGKGRVLGCWSTLLNEPHILMSSAVCQHPAKILVMKGSDLREMMIQNKSFGFYVMERFCFLLRDRIQAAYGALERI